MSWHSGMGSQMSNWLDKIVPYSYERYLPLPRWHPWIFGFTMFAWGMIRQGSFDRGSTMDFLGVEFPIAPSFATGSRGILGRGDARSIIGLSVVAVTASLIAQLMREGGK